MSMNSTKFRHALLGASAMISAAAIAGAAYAADARAYDFDMPAQPLTLALKTFGATADQQLIFSEGLVKDRLAPPLKGAYTPDQALAMLLNGSGLIADKTPGGVVTIRSASDPQGAGASDGAEGTVQALIVTAQKREENIQDVPIAMSAFTQEDLTKSQVAGGPDLMTQVPNFTFTKTNFSGYSIQIRGIGTQAISATTDPAVAVALNNTPFLRNRFFEQEFYDLERVEVLRGPQGTLYGRNATAGVVNIISQKPKFAYESRLSLDVGNYNSQRLEGMVNVPLVDDKVALRLAGAWTKRDGYDTNQLTGNRIDGRDLWSTRLSLRFAPTDKIDVNLIWEHFQENDDRLRSGKQLCHKDIVTEVGGVPIPNYYDGQFGGGGQSTHYQSQLSQGCKPASLYSPDSFETPNGYTLGFYWPLAAAGLPINRAVPAHDPYVSRVQSRDLRVIESTVDPKYRAKTDTVELQAKFDLTDNLSLTSETAWSSDFIWSMEDYNRFNTASGAWASSDPNPGVLNNGVFCDPQIGCADRLVSVDLSTARSRDFSQEFRLASDFEGPFNFSVGANFLHYDTVEKYYVFINALNLWAASNFDTGVTIPYIPNVSDNRRCAPNGLRTISLQDSGSVATNGGECAYIDPNHIDAVNDLSHTYFLSKNPFKLVSYAVFGEAYYQIAPNLKLTAGLRWTVDKKDAPRIPSWVLAKDVGYPVAEIIKQEWREPTGRLTLDWKPDLSFTDETLVYGSYSHGYKAGGANPPVAGVALNGGGLEGAHSITHPKTFDPEFVNAYEVGAKNTLLGGRLTLNGGAFFYDYTGYQISQIVDRSAINYNFDATVWGAELETDWRPLENLRLGLKLGYEKTRVANGMKAVDVMDRANGGLPDANGVSWIVVKPFPIYPSNCILPAYLSSGTGIVHQIGNVAGSSNDGCSVAYLQGLDPITNRPYVANPPGGPYWTNGGYGYYYPNYPGFNPASAPNNGEGFSKDLSGHELPNAPHYTATLTADYTLPLPSDWLMTLHADLYHQSEAWGRIFNTPGYDKLKAYNNVNLAAIFSNDDAGWKVMAYVKNVFNKDNITGAFLNSDDTGLTTNVFLNEPRLYGLRVTKEWTGGPWWTGASANHPAGAPWPLTVEVSGQVQRHDAPYAPLRPSFADALPPSLDIIDNAQNQNLDWGDGREARLTYRPDSGPWNISAGIRYGKTNAFGPRLRAEEHTPIVCGLAATPFSAYCDPNYLGGRYYNQFNKSQTNWTLTSSHDRDEFDVAEFSVGRDIGIGGLTHSTVSGGLRYAQFKSKTETTADTVPDWSVPQTWYFKYSTHSRKMAGLAAKREFKGAGPEIAWQAASHLVGSEDSGHIDIDWSVAGGMLFGKQRTEIAGYETVSAYRIRGSQLASDFTPSPASTTTTPVSIRRATSASVPLVDLSLGLSYEIQRIKVGAGYRWERYYNALDAGDVAHKSYDRTMDGPYLTIAVGFGG